MRGVSEKIDSSAGAGAFGGNVFLRRRRASLFTLGCRLNQYESDVLRDRLAALGFEIVPWGAPAELGIVNSCTVTKLAEAKCRQIIRGFVKANPAAFCAVVGCYSQTGAAALARIPGVDLIVGNREKLNVAELVARFGAAKRPAPAVVCGRLSGSDFFVPATPGAPIVKRANLKVQDGCNFGCSYCIIPTARGRARSRDFDDLVAEARSLAARGVREITLTGINIGTYANGGNDILAVVDAVAAVPGIDRLRIGSIEPKTVPEGIFERMSDPKHALAPFLHLPLQSGCDRILRDMRRHYSLGEYLDFLKKIVAGVPDICVGTDIMIGFPGETDAEFDETCRAFTQNPFAYAHVFTYSEREGTPAARRPDRVPVPVRQRRSAALRALSAAQLRRFMERFLGREEEILLENLHDGFFPGYTKNYLRVMIPAEDAGGENIANTFRRVRLGGFCGDAFSGKLVD